MTAAVPGSGTTYRAWLCSITLTQAQGWRAFSKATLNSLEPSGTSVALRNQLQQPGAPELRRHLRAAAAILREQRRLAITRP